MASTRDVSAILGMNCKRLYHLLHAGVIPKPATRFGAGFVWTDDDVEAARRALAEHNSRWPVYAAAVAAAASA